MKPHCFVMLLTWVFVSVCSATAQQFNERFEHWPTETTIGGKVIVLGRKVPSAEQRKLLSGAFNFNRSLTLVTEKTTQDWLKSSFFNASITDNGTDKSKPSSAVNHWLTLGSLNPDKLTNELASKKFLTLLAEEEPTEKEIQLLVKYAPVVKNWLKTGGTLFVNGPLAPAFGRFIGKKFRKGPNFIPDSFLKTDFRERQAESLQSIIKARRPLVGIGLTTDCLLVLSGRRVSVLTGSAHFLLPSHNKYLHSRNTKLISRSQQRRSGRRLASTVSSLDFTQWRRMAIDRTLPQFPADNPEKPFVAKGTLVIVGGGGMPKGLIQEIVDLAGGNRKAKMVYVPCSQQESVPPRQGIVRLWKQMGIQHASFIHTKDRVKANSDEEFLKPLKNATGIWFGGGRQWNFSDSYYGTKAHRLMKQVLDRGGVIGGSSAGASIQGRYLARATPIGNFSIMAPGYERGGLGFLSGVAIDQHFSQRRRQKDMTTLVKRYPQLLGIGIDEATAIIVQKSQAKVVGRGRVFFYDKGSKINDEGKDYVSLPKGSVYDLAKRKIISDSRIARQLEKIE